MEVFIMQAIEIESGTLKRRRTLSSLAADSSGARPVPVSGCAEPRGASGISADAAETVVRRCVTAIAMCL
jgi:hypothetical protein